MNRSISGRFAAKDWMRVLCAFVTIMMLFAYVLPVAGAASTTGTATEDVLLRSKASTDSVPLATIRKGREVTVQGTEGSWYKVKTGSLTGYVQSKYITLDSESFSASDSSKSASSSSSSSEALKSGDESDAVKELQKKLKELGYFNESATGTFGSLTKEAVIAFQKANGLEADGVAGANTLRKIENSRTTTAEKQSTSGILEKGSEGNAVKSLQNSLKELGYFSGDVTGYYGSQTSAAVKSYQAAMGLTQDGVAGADTLVKINQSSGSTNASSSSALKLGDTGEEVMVLQRLLKNAGFYSGSIDGNFGDGTKDALLAYQKAAGLSADGVAGSKTIVKLASNSVSADKNIPTITEGTSSGNSSSSNNTDSSSSGSNTNSNSSDSSNSSSGNVAQAQVNGSVRLVDWWSGEIDSAIPRKGTAQVLDIRSGKTFTIYRYGGTNHLDWEPYTQADTDILNSITGGDWSWSARPVIVTASNGNRYAAAINTYPHGSAHLTGNGYYGMHNCMHFLNSRTHGSNTINQGMQSEIMVAFNSGN